jgi:HD-like signal output (HDOD) protein
MHFAPGGEEALALMAVDRFDVVVSDMRMPGMDGAELLTAVRINSPGTARIILSGFAEEEAVFRSTRVAHQFLSKPCDVDLLKKTISEIRAAQQAVPSERIRDLVGGIDQLPVLGDVYQRLVAAMESEGATNEDLAAIISEDIALTAELVRLVNSAFFGLPRRVESVSQAVGFLGIDVVRAVVVGYSVYTSNHSTMIDVDTVRRRSQQVAALARRSHSTLYGRSSAESADVFLAGMLHEVGVLVLSMVHGVDPIDLKGVLGSNDVTTERLTVGADRFAVGGYLLGLWGFSPDVVEAVASLSRPLEPAPQSSSMSWALGLARHALDHDLVAAEDSTDQSVADELILELDRALRQDLALVATECP